MVSGKALVRGNDNLDLTLKLKDSNLFPNEIINSNIEILMKQ